MSLRSGKLMPICLAKAALAAGLSKLTPKTSVSEVSIQREPRRELRQPEVRGRSCVSWTVSHPNRDASGKESLHPAVCLIPPEWEKYSMNLARKESVEHQWPHPRIL